MPHLNEEVALYPGSLGMEEKSPVHTVGTCPYLWHVHLRAVYM